MRFKHTYSATGFSDFVATDPGGWDQASIGFERDAKLLSLVEFFKSSFTTYGTNGQPVYFDLLRNIDGGRDHILAIEAANGCDSQITHLVEIDENDDDTWEYFFSSVLSVNELVESLHNSHLLQTVPSQSDFWTKFVKRFNTPVDLKSLVDLDGNAVAATPSFTLPLPCQLIQKTTKKDFSAIVAPGGYGNFAIGGGPPMYLMFAWNILTFDEIATRQDYPTQIDTNDPVAFKKYLFKIKEKGDYVFKIIRPVYSIISDFNFNGSVSWWLVTGKQGGYTTTQIGSTNTFVGRGAGGLTIQDTTPDLTLKLVNHAVTLDVDDEVYVYGILTNTSAVNATLMQYIYSPAYSGGLAPFTIEFELVGQTSTPDSSTDAFLTYNVIKGIIQRICGAPFKSDYLGNPYTSDIYGATGCGSMLANMLGLHIRGYSLADKPFQSSAQDWHDGINPIHCLGIGYEKIASVDTIVCERPEHFFDDSNVSVDFLNIYDVKRSYDQDWQFNKLSFGNQKWESQAATGVGSPSGIDDPQSQRTWTNIFKFIGKELKQFSKWVVASLTIETARRLGTNQSSNYTYDNDVFAIKLHDNGGGAFVPETDQPFSAITNLLNSTTRYNSDLTPARNLLRWAKYWSGCLQDYVGSVIKYASGVGNFLMTSTKTTSCDGDDTGNVVAENGDFVVGSDYLFLPTPIEINHKLDWTTYKYLRDHKNWAVTISQTGDVGVKAFIKSLEYFKAKGTIKMVVWPKTKFTIQNIESIATGEGVVPGIKYFQIPEFADEFE